MSDRRYSFDPDCLELAEHFLEDETGVLPSDFNDLAQHIQDAVEMWFVGRAPPPPAASLYDQMPADCELPSNENCQDIP